METLIIKLDATGDVVRTTPLLHRLTGQVTWLTAAKNTVLLDKLGDNLQCFSWEERHRIPTVAYDLVINLEDSLGMAQFVRSHRTLSVSMASLESRTVDHEVSSSTSAATSLEFRCICFAGLQCGLCDG